MRNNLSEDVTIENVRERWDQIADMSTNVDYPTAPEEAMGKFMDALRMQEKGLGDASSVTRSNLSQISFPEMKYKYKVNDTILYALGCKYLVNV